MRTQGNVAAYEHVGALSYPRITMADAKTAVVAYSSKPDAHRLVPNKIDRWRRENPDALRTWATNHGCVVQFWGMRVYYGACKECGALLTARRNVAKHRRGPTIIGRWPELCEPCRVRKSEADNNAARGRMRRLRAARELKPGASLRDT